MICLFSRSKRFARDFKAQLSASVPPLVKNISSGRAPIAEATVSLAFSTARLESRPNEYTEEGFAYSAFRYGSMASKAFSDSAQVAALSAYTICFVINTAPCERES